MKQENYDNTVELLKTLRSEGKGTDAAIKEGRASTRILAAQLLATLTGEWQPHPDGLVEGIDVPVGSQ